MKKCLLPLLLLLGVAVSAAQPVTLPGGTVVTGLALNHLPDKGSRLDSDILAVSVPPERKGDSNLVTARLDLKPYRNKTIQLSVPVRADNVSVPEQKWNGIKFQMAVKSADGETQYQGSALPTGSFDWQLAAFDIPVTGNDGTLQFGLQDSSGTVEFDLSKLKIRVLHSADNDTYRAEYTPEVQNRIRRRGVMLPQRDMTRDDLETLAKWNVNLIRFQFCRNWGRRGTDRDLADYDRWFDERLNNLDYLVSEAPKYGIQVVIDLHTPPGGWKDPHNVMCMFSELEYAGHFLELWQKLATHFKGNPGVWAYDLINEPRALKKNGFDDWKLQLIAAQLIREIDPDTPILVTTNWGGGTGCWDEMRAFELKNIIYQLHFYNPIGYTHQYVHQKRRPDEPFRTYPGEITQNAKTESWDKERLRRELNGVLNFSKKHNAKIYVGEFSAIGWAPGADRYLRDCIELFEENGWDWSYHSFRESPFWNVEMKYDGEGNFIPAPEGTARQSVLREYFVRNSTPEKKETAK